MHLEKRRTDKHRKLLMKYDAISIDTSIFDQYNLNLEGGLLAQLSQFKNGAHKLILADIVVAEVRQHMILQAERAQEQLLLALRNGQKYRLIANESKSDADSLAADLVGATKAVDARITAMQNRTEFEAVAAQNAKIEDVLDRYFKGLPPFDSSPDKKSEFPDAIALLSLEKWAHTRDARVILVSKDKGWANYAKSSKRLDWVSDLASALQRVQDDVAEVDSDIQRHLKEMSEGDETHRDRQFMHDEISRQLADRFIIAEANSAYALDSDYAEASLKNLAFAEVGEAYDTKIVNLEKDKVVVRLTIEIEIHATANFSFYIDQDQLDAQFPFSIGTYETNVYRTTAVLLTFSGDLRSEKSELSLDEVELVTPIQYIDFGDIEPSYDDYEDYVEDKRRDAEYAETADDDGDVPW